MIDTAIYTKTVAGVASGYIRKTLGDRLCLGNALAAIEMTGQLMAGGIIKPPKADLSASPDFQALAEHSAQVTTIDRIKAYVETIPDKDIPALCDAAERLMQQQFNDPDLVPMSDADKAQILRSLTL